MLIFGIDPGSIITGYGIIRSKNNSIFFKDAGVIATAKKASLPEKLEQIYDGLCLKMKEWEPDCVCVEKAFYAKNVHTTLVLGHARGVALLAASKSGAKVFEFTPREIKKVVVGNGNADKSQVKFMVKILLNLPDENIGSDMYDALATAICGFINITGRKV